MTDEPATTADEPVAARPARREPSGRFALALVGAFLAGMCLTGCAGAALVAAAAHAVRHERSDRDWHHDRDRWHERPEWYDRDRQYPPPPQVPVPPAPVPPVTPPKPPAATPAPPAPPSPSPSRTS